MTLSHTVLTDPSLLHWHAGRHNTHGICPWHMGRIPPRFPQTWGAWALLQARLPHPHGTHLGTRQAQSQKFLGSSGGSAVP